MTTRSTMLAEIQSDMERSSTADISAMRDKIGAAVRQYQPVRFWFNEKRSVTFPLVAGTDFYTFATIGTTFYGIDGAYITVVAGDVRPLDKSDYSDMEAVADSSTIQDVPTDFAYVEGGIRLYPTPDDAYTVRLTGHVKLDGPSEDDTDNDWLTYAYDLIKARAKAELYLHRWENAAMAQAMAIAEAQALNALQRATSAKTSLGFLTATDF